MKTYNLLILAALFLISCEDVIDVDLDTSEPKLIIEATVNLKEDGTSTVLIKLSETAPFFNTIIPPVTDAVVTITADTGEVFTFPHVGDGLYTALFIPELETNYTLEVIHEGEIYTATESLNPVVSLEEIVEQEDEGGFLGDEIELTAFFTDPGGIDNYYLIEVLIMDSTTDEGLEAFSDEFFDGNTIPIFYVDEALEPGVDVTFNLYGADQEFFNFMTILLQQIEDGGGGPFETQPATVRGNMVNQTNPDNFPLGYFRISEISTVVYTVQ